MKNEEDKKMEGGEKHDEKKQEGEDRQGEEGGEKPEEGGVVQEDQLVYQSRESQQAF